MGHIDGLIVISISDLNIKGLASESDSTLVRRCGGRRGRQNHGQLLPAALPRGAGLAAMALAASERASRRMSRIAFHSFRESSVV